MISWTVSSVVVNVRFPQKTVVVSPAWTTFDPSARGLSVEKRTFRMELLSMVPLVATWAAAASACEPYSM